MQNEFGRDRGENASLLCSQTSPSILCYMSTSPVTEDQGRTGQSIAERESYLGAQTVDEEVERVVLDECARAYEAIEL